MIAAIVEETIGLPGDMVVPADYDGDGIADEAITMAMARRTTRYTVRKMAVGTSTTAGTDLSP